MLHVAIRLFIAIAFADPEPFWRSKPKVYERVRNGEVIVAVRSEKKRFEVNGGGHVSAPRAFVFQKVSAFDEFVKVSDYVKRATYDASTQRLRMRVEAYGLHADMDLKISAKEPDLVTYEMVGGPLKGMTGDFNLRELPNSRTEVGMKSEYRYETLPIPAFFLRFGFEVVFKRMAMTLRKYLESEYSKSKAVAA